MFTVVCCRSFLTQLDVYTASDLIWEPVRALFKNITCGLPANETWVTQPLSSTNSLNQVIASPVRVEVTQHEDQHVFPDGINLDVRSWDKSDDFWSSFAWSIQNLWWKPNLSAAVSESVTAIALLPTSSSEIQLDRLVTSPSIDSPFPPQSSDVPRIVSGYLWWCTDYSLCSWMQIYPSNEERVTGVQKSTLKSLYYKSSLLFDAYCAPPRPVKHR